MSLAPQPVRMSMSACSTKLSIRVTWFDYDGYRDYKQLWGGFEPAVSILDLLFNVGAEAPDYLRYCRQ